MKNVPKTQSRLTALLLAVVLTLGTGTSVPVFADTPTDVGPGYIAPDVQTLPEQCKLSMIKVLGNNLPGFDKNKLDYTYYMSAKDQTDIAGLYNTALTAERVSTDASLIISVVKNKVMLTVNVNGHTEFATYTVTFENTPTDSSSDKIKEKNRYLQELLTSQYNESERIAHINESLNGILTEIDRATEPREASLSFQELQQTLSTVHALTAKMKDPGPVITRLSDVTYDAGKLVYRMTNPGQIADLTSGYFSKSEPLLANVGSSDAPGTTLRNSMQKLGTESVTKTGVFNTPSSSLTIEGSTATVTYNPSELSAHIKNATENFSKISGALNASLGSSDPRKLQMVVSLHTDRPTSVSELHASITHELLNQVLTSGADRTELSLGEAAVSLGSKTLSGSEKTLALDASFTAPVASGLPSGTSAIPGSVTAELTLSSDTGKITAFDNPIQLSFDLSPLNLNGLSAKDLKNLSIYRLNDETGIWEPVGGNYDPLGKTIHVYRNHLSKYSVLKTDRSFSDVQNSWAKDDINELLGKGVVKDQALFSPDAALTREEFALWISKAYGLEASGTQMPFTDVPKNHPYYKQLTAAWSQGLIKGKSATTFDPKAQISRQEMAALISNALLKYHKANLNNALAAKLDKYPDSKRIAAWSKDYVAMVNDLGIMQGDARGFPPNDYFTRLHPANLFTRLYN